MKNESIRKIRKMLTPEITIVACADRGDKIIGEMNYGYHLPLQEGGAPIPCGKVISFVADQEGNVISYEGVF